MRVLVNGAAGFIGHHVSGRLLSQGDDVIAVDDLSDSYPAGLKEARLAHLLGKPNFQFHKVNATDQPAIADLVATAAVDAVIHLAAREGVRDCLENPYACIAANVVGFLNILEVCRHAQVRHLVFASSSEAHDAYTQPPASAHDNADDPIGANAAVKQSNELMARCYSHLYGLPTTGLRLFTVYGPWSNPDMAAFQFTRNILEGRPIDVLNNGAVVLDFTYVDDVVEGMVRVLDAPPRSDTIRSPENTPPGVSDAPFRIYNVGANEPITLLRFIEVLEQTLGRKAAKNFVPTQSSANQGTLADAHDLADAMGIRSRTTIEDGLSQFVSWYRSHYESPLHVPAGSSRPVESTA